MVAYLQARCDTGSSIPRIAVELGVRDWQVQAALARLAVRLAPRAQRLAAQRRRYTEERIAARVAALGFAEVRAYLVDRVGEQGWRLEEVATELAAHRLTVRRLLERHGIRRIRRTPAERAAAESGRQVQRVSWQARRAGRLAELGFQDLAGYLRARHVAQGWSVKRMRDRRTSGWPQVAGEGADPAGAATLTRRSDAAARVGSGVLLPGCTGFSRLSNGVGARRAQAGPSESRGWEPQAASTPAPLCGRSIFRRSPRDGYGAAEWQVIDA